MQVAPRRAEALGQPRVWIASRGISKKAWGSRRAQELFFLLMNHPAGLTKDQIAHRLFPGMNQEKSEGLFHSTLYRCRKALEVEVVVLEDDVYRVADVVEWKYDVAEFEALVKRARRLREDPREAEGLCHTALQLYEGDYLEGRDSEWCEPIRVRLKQLYLEAVLAVARLAARHGPPEDALEWFRLAIAKDYYCEAAHKGIVDCLLEVGDRLAAVRHHLDLVQRLKQDVPPEERSEIPGVVEDMLGRSLHDLLVGDKAAHLDRVGRFRHAQDAKTGELLGGKP